MTSGFLWLLVTFNILLVITLWRREKRQRLFRRGVGEWVLDVTGLCLHGLLVPWVQTALVYGGLHFALSEWEGVWVVPPWIGFSIAFVGVDYLYYWNHRLLHHANLWRFHAVHHSSQSMDVFATSRNSFLTSFLTLYVWVNGILLFFLHDKEAFIVGVLLTNMLDILRHSGIRVWSPFWPLRWFTSPHQHTWHHSTDKFGINFGGNFNLWDRLHGTFYEDLAEPESCGFALPRDELWPAFWKGYHEDERSY